MGEATVDTLQVRYGYVRNHAYITLLYQHEMDNSLALRAQVKT